MPNHWQPGYTHQVKMVQFVCVPVCMIHSYTFEWYKMRVVDTLHIHLRILVHLTKSNGEFGKQTRWTIYQYEILFSFWLTASWILISKCEPILVVLCFTEILFENIVLCVRKLTRFHNKHFAQAKDSWKCSNIKTRLCHKMASCFGYEVHG